MLLSRASSSITRSIWPVYIIISLEYFFNKKACIFDGINIINPKNFMHLFSIPLYINLACRIKILLMRL